jgi:hypothetical protein
MKLTNKVWIVIEASALHPYHLTPEDARKAAEEMAEANIGKQFIVFEAEAAHEAEAVSRSESLYRDWNASKAVEAAPPPPAISAEEVAEAATTPDSEDDYPI